MQSALLKAGALSRPLSRRGAMRSFGVVLGVTVVFIYLVFADWATDTTSDTPAGGSSEPSRQRTSRGKQAIHLKADTVTRAIPWAAEAALPKLQVRKAPAQADPPAQPQMLFPPKPFTQADPPAQPQMLFPPKPLTQADPPAQPQMLFPPKPLTQADPPAQPQMLFPPKPLTQADPPAQSQMILPPKPPTQADPPAQPQMLFPPKPPTQADPPAQPQMLFPPKPPTQADPPAQPQMLFPPKPPTQADPPAQPQMLFPPKPPTQADPPAQPQMLFPPKPAAELQPSAAAKPFRCDPYAPVIRILAFGDSITEGGYGIFEHPQWGMNHNAADYQKPKLRFHPYTRRLSALLLQHRYNSVTLTNKGIAGETAAHMVTRLPLVLQKEPAFNAAFVLAGTNDLNRGSPPAKVLEHVTRLHRALAARNVTGYQISLPQCCPFTTTNAQLHGFAKRCAAYNPLLEDVHGPRGAYVDMAALIPMEEGTKRLWDDCMHYSPKGYDVMGEHLFNFLRPRLEASCRAGCQAACPSSA